MIDGDGGVEQISEVPGLRGLEGHGEGDTVGVVGVVEDDLASAVEVADDPQTLPASGGGGMAHPDAR
ncbi:MAG TPA: hypothetical protein VF755_15130 [Catenuloplanes sp.]